MIGTIHLGGRKGLGGVGLGSLSGFSLPSNQAPTITVPGGQSTTSNVALAITGTSIADPDGNSQTLTITTNQSGTISLASTSGLTGSGNGTNSISYSGTLANINTAIATLTYTTALDVAGAETITIGTNDGTVSATPATIVVTSTWTPASLTTDLVAWFDPSFGTYEDAGTDAAEVLDPVYQWTAKAGAASIVMQQGILGSRPILNQGGTNSKFYMTGNGTSIYLAATSTSAGNLTGDFFVWALANFTANGDKIIVSKQKATASYNGYGLGKSGSNKLLGEVSDGTYTSKAGTTTIGTGDGWKSYAMKRATTTATVYINGTSDGSGAVQGGDTAFAVALNIGRFMGGTSYMSGSWAHIVIASAAISDARKTLLETWSSAEKPT